MHKGFTHGFFLLSSVESFMVNLTRAGCSSILPVDAFATGIKNFD